jgi:hypothetical protein
VTATRSTPKPIKAKPDKPRETQPGLVFCGRTCAACELLSTTWNKNDSALFRGQNFRQIHCVVEWRSSGGNSILLQQKGHDVHRVRRRHRTRRHHWHLRVHARPQGRNLLASICCPELPADQRRPHFASKRCTVTTGTALLVSLCTRGRLLGGIPSTIRCCSPDAKRAHQQQNVRNKNRFQRNFHARLITQTAIVPELAVLLDCSRKNNCRPGNAMP